MITLIAGRAKLHWITRRKFQRHSTYLISCSIYNHAFLDMSLSRYDCKYAILKAGFPIFVAIMQVLVSVFAYIYQPGETLNLCCNGNSDKHEIWLKMTDSTSVFCGCDPLERHIFWGHTFYVTLNSTWSCQASPEIWHFWHLWRLLAYEYQQLKLAILGTPLEGRELYTVRQYNFVNIKFHECLYFSKCFDFESCINYICI